MENQICFISGTPFKELAVIDGLGNFRMIQNTICFFQTNLKNYGFDQSHREQVGNSF